MVRLIVLLVMLGGPAAADCLKTYPTAVDFDSGRTVQILDHTARDVTYRVTLPDGSIAVNTMRQGLFLTTSGRDGVTIRYDWIDPLPALADLGPGSEATLQADMVVEHATRQFFTTHYKYVKDDVIRLNDCEYSVVVVEVADTLNGVPMAQMQLWVSKAYRFPLRTIATAHGKTEDFRAVALR